MNYGDMVSNFVKISLILLVLGYTIIASTLYFAKQNSRVSFIYLFFDRLKISFSILKEELVSLLRIFKNLSSPNKYLV